MNRHEAEKVAAAVHELRHDWPVASILTVLARPPLCHRPWRAVAVALTWVACEYGTHTPARVLEAGPWWVAANVDGGLAPRDPHYHEACRTCGRRLQSCICGEKRTKPEPPAEDQKTASAAARQAIQPTRSGSSE